MAAVEKMILSGDERIDGILNGSVKWSGPRLTFSLATSSSVWDKEYGSNLPFAPEYAVANAVQAANLRTAFTTWASYIDLPLVEVADNATTAGDLRLAFSLDPTRPTASLGTYPSSTPAGGDIWLNNNGDFESGYQVGTGYYFAALHEIGHALGLKHPFAVEVGNNAVLDMEHQVRMNTILAYENVAGNPNIGTSFFPTTPMVYDILAIQYLYGRDTTTNAGDTNYAFSDAKPYYETIHDAGGTNAFTYMGSKNATIDLNQGQGSYIGQENWLIDYTTWNNIGQVANVWIAHDTVIHHATTGSGNDTLIGNAADNILSGGAGFDTVRYAGEFADYTMAVNGAVVSVSSAADGDDTLHDIERVTFSDAAVAFDVDGKAGQAYRVYQAAFAREPDHSGLGFWINAMDGGMSLSTVAENFVVSGEFLEKYGTNPGTSELVARLYANVLGREADPGGYEFWVRQLDTKAVTVAQVLASFSESPENVVALTGIMEQGMVYTPYA